MSRVSVQGIVGSGSPSDRALVRDAGGEPRCDPAKIPKEIACLPCERSSSFQAFAMLASRDDGQPPSSLHTEKKDAHSSVISSVAFSPDGKTILSGSWDKTLKVCTIALYSVLRSL